MAEVDLPASLDSPVGGAKALNVNAWMDGREHLGWSQCWLRPSFVSGSPADGCE